MSERDDRISIAKARKEFFEVTGWLSSSQHGAFEIWCKATKHEAEKSAEKIAELESELAAIRKQPIYELLGSDTMIREVFNNHPYFQTQKLLQTGETFYLLPPDAQAMLDAGNAELEATREENLELKAMVERLMEALDTVARVSNDHAIITCAKHAISATQGEK